MSRDTTRSRALFDEARRILPGGVNSPVRAFKAVGGDPLFIDHGSGATIVDADGTEYIDYVLSWGPLILGHAHPSVVRAVAEQAARGTSFGAPTEHETRLASAVQRFFPAMDLVRFVNSGTEATMSALRVARGFTGRAKILKFEGCYHGHADALLVKAGSGVATLGLPDSPGVTEAVASDTIVAPYNDLDAVHREFERHPRRIAAVIVEPVAGNMGVIPPAAGFLAGLRELTTKDAAVLIFDEVMTGFRVHPGGAQALYGVTPDLTTLGKVIGGGLPVGAYGGRSDMMDLVAPAGPIYQAGTLSGNPLAMAAGLATLTALEQPGFWDGIAAAAERVATALGEAAVDAGIPLRLHRIGTMFSGFFTTDPVTDWASASRCDTDRYGRFFRAMLEGGVYLAPSQFEAAFLSSAHGEDEIERTALAARAAFAAV